jgi:hypothetical protein
VDMGGGFRSELSEELFSYFYSSSELEYNNDSPTPIAGFGNFYIIQSKFIIKDL